MASARSNQRVPRTRSSVQRHSVAASELAHNYYRITPNKRKREETGTPSKTTQIPYRDAPLHSFTCEQLSKVCRLRKIRGYSKLSKGGLLKIVEAELLKSGEALFDTSRHIVAWPKQPINDTDAVSQNDLTGRNPLYTFCVEAKDPSSASLPLHSPANLKRLVHRFDPVSLVQMIVATGEIVNPYNRVPFTAQEIEDLEHLYASCLRGHAGTPGSKDGLLRMRPDMSKSRIQTVPSRRDLGLDESQEGQELEPFPAPVDGFAPWLCPDNLGTVARQRKIIVEQERQEEETRVFLRDRVTSALDATLAFLAPIDGIVSERTATALMEVILHVFVPLLLESIEELFYSAREDMREVLPTVIRRLIDAKGDLPDELMRHGAAWVLGMLLDDCLSHSARACSTEDVTDEDAEWVYAYVGDFVTEHATAALVRQSVHLQYFTLLVQ